MQTPQATSDQDMYVVAIVNRLLSEAADEAPARQRIRARLLGVL